MKRFILLLALFSASNAFAAPNCNRYGILDELIQYDMMDFQNKKYPIVLGVTADNLKIQKFAKDCPVIYLSPMATDKKPAAYHYGRNGGLVLKTDYQQMVNLLSTFTFRLYDTQFNMSIKAGEPLSQVKNRMSPELDKQLVNTLTPVRPCDFHGFFKTFVDVKNTKANKSIEPPLPSYDGSSSEFVMFKRDPSLLDGFVKDCATISNGSKKFAIDKNKLLSAMNNVEAVHAKKPIKTLGYMGGVWNEGDYYMSSDEQIEDAIRYEFFEAL